MVAAVLLGAIVFPATSNATLPGYNGRLLYEAADSSAYLDVYDVGLAGTDARDLTNTPGVYDVSPAYSPDGSKIAFWSNREGLGHCEIYVMSSDGAGPTRITNGDTNCTYTSVAWSPDGARLAVVRNDSSAHVASIWVMDADGSNESQLSPTGTTMSFFEPVWSPDGSRIAALESPPNGFSSDIVSIAADGSGVTDLTCCGSNHTFGDPDWSPDGAKLVFAETTSSGDPDYAIPGIYTVNSDGTGLAPIVTTNIGYPSYASPVWSPDGSKIAYTYRIGGGNAGSQADIFVMDADGYNPIDITNTPNVDEVLQDWQPLANAPADEFVTRSGTQLMLHGRPYRPIGVNIYNANSNGWCSNEMNGSALDNALTAIGPGKNALRSWFFQQLATTNGVRDWSAFDRTLAAARAHGYKVIATLIDQWGDCGATNGLGYGYKTAAWYEGGYEQPDPSATVSYRDWVQEVVARYKDNPTILAWQLVNEPEVGSCDDVDESTAQGILSSFATDVSGVIKSIDPNHLVSLGTIGGGQCGTSGPDYRTVMSIPTLDLCEYHDYTPSQLIPGDQFNGLALRIQQCNALNKPLLVGELGVKPSDAGGTLAGRASLVDSKLCAQLTAGVAGALLWAWDQPDPFDIVSGDPVLGVLTPWSDPGHTCTPPSAPSNVVAAAGDGSAVIGWLPPTSNGGSVIQSYTVTVAPGGQSTTVGPDQTSATVGGLVDGQAYTFTVAATNAAGTSNPTPASASVTPTVGYPFPVVVSGTIDPGGTVTSDPNGTGPTPQTPVTAAVTVPFGGDVGLTVGGISEAPSAGYLFVGAEVGIDAAPSTVDLPLQLLFTIDASALGTFAPDQVGLFRSEGGGSPTAVPACAGGSGTASPDPCVVSRTLLANGDLQLAVLSSSASLWDFGVLGEPRVVVDSVSKSLLGPSDASTKVTWHADENGTFSVRVGGTSCTSGTQVATGSYTGSPAAHATTANATSLSEGVNLIRVCVTDSSARTNSGVVTVTKDTTPPTVTVESAVPSLLGAADNSTAISWHSTENGNFSVRVGGASCTAGTLAASGPYTGAPATVSTSVSASSLAAGANTLRVCVKDAAGNTGSQTISVTKDTAAPKVTIDSTVPAVVGAGGAAVVTWHANENGSFTVRVGGADCISGVAAAGGGYSTEPAKIAASIPASLLADGANTIRVCVTDVAGNSGSTTTTVTKDTTAPAVQIDSAIPSLLTGAGSSVVTWHASEKGTFNVLVGGADCGSGTQLATGSYTTAPATRTTTVKSSSLAEGANTIRVCVTDASANTGMAATPLTKDSVAPTVTAEGASPSVLGAATGSTSLSWHASENGTYSIRVGGSCTAGTQVAGGSYDTAPATRVTMIDASSLAVGANTIRVCVTDQAGNTASATVSVKKDITAPTITITRPGANAAYTVGQVVKASYTCKDETGGSGIAGCIGSVASGSALDTGSPGAKTFTVTATDQAGNTTTRVISYTVS